MALSATAEKYLIKKKASYYLDSLLNNIEWKNDEAVIFGKHIITKRKVAWYGDSGFSYTYSKITRHALVWTNELLALKKITEDITKTKFNSCLLNLYHDGDEGMAWHSDDEKTLGTNSAIASLSLGAERKFSFKHKKNTGDCFTFIGKRQFTGYERNYTKQLASSFAKIEEDKRAENKPDFQNDDIRRKLSCETSLENNLFAPKIEKANKLFRHAKQCCKHSVSLYFITF